MSTEELIVKNRLNSKIVVEDTYDAVIAHISNKHRLVYSYSNLSK